MKAPETLIHLDPDWDEFVDLWVTEEEARATVSEINEDLAAYGWSEPCLLYTSDAADE